MIVNNNVAFTGLKQTKNGNLYEKKNTGKRIGTAVGLIGGAVISRHPVIQAESLITSLELAARKVPVHSSVLLGAGILAATLLCRALGSIPDAIINKKRRAKADALAAEQNK